MTPNFTLMNFMYQLSANTVAGSDFMFGPSACEDRANDSHGRFVQFSHAMMLAASACFWSGLPTCATFANHVLQVVRLSAKKQMGRLNTKRHIAGVAYLKTVRDWPYGKCISETVGKNLLAVSVSLSTVNSVTGTDCGSSPDQTFTLAACSTPEFGGKLFVGNNVHKPLILPRFAVV